ncbi:hypothetical protein PybrP1_012830 [[Pythium] brassicae (nom. inval.)]|nr:hypothetical protein PybrP1_012830 [[Pythium] brassicae (nom. inval.)]
MTKHRAAFSTSACGKKASGARHSSSGDAAEEAAASVALETPTGSSDAATISSSSSLTPRAKLADVNRRVTRPIRLLHENVMLELFQEQLRTPSPVRQSEQSSEDARTSITRQSVRPTVILYEASFAALTAAARADRGEAQQQQPPPAATAAAAVRAELLEGFDMALQRECQICFDKMDALQAHVCLECNTAFCSTCMQWYVEFKILDGEVSAKKLVCPSAHCARPLAPELVEAFAAPESFAKYQSFLKNQKLGVRFCPRAGCCAALDEPPFSSTRRAACTACDAESCMRCGGAYHRARLCRRVDKRYGRWKRRHNVRACPTCKADIEKQGGCSHMKCFQCDQEFCWACLRNWDHHDETLCIPLAFYHSKSRKYGCWGPLRFVTKSVVLSVAGAVAVAGAGVAVVVLPPLIGYHLVRDSLQRRKHLRDGPGDVGVNSESYAVQGTHPVVARPPAHR